MSNLDIGIHQSGGLDIGIHQSSGSSAQNIFPDSIPSAEDWGTLTIAGAPQSATVDSIFSTESWGSPVVAGPISPGTIASAESWGVPDVNATQKLLLLTIASAEAWGSPRVSNVIPTHPGTIPSAEAWGDVNVVGGRKRILASSIPSAEAWGPPMVTGGERQLQIFVGNIDRRRWVQFSGSEIRSQTLGRWTGTLLFLNVPGGEEALIDTEDEWIPSLGQIIQIREFDHKLLTGCISEIDTDRFSGTNVLAYTCQVGDKGSICDHRVITVQKYTADQDVADIYRDIIANYLDGEGIQASAIPNSLGPLGSDLQIYYWNVTQAFDAISNLTGLQWYVDVDSLFQAVNPTIADPAPFNLGEDTRNYRNLQVQTSLDAYRNRQYVISNRNTVDNGITEHWTVPSDWFRDFLGYPDASAPDNRGSGKLKYNVQKMISIKLNGVAQDFASLIDPVDWSVKWLYLQGSPYVYSPNDPATFPLDGDIVEVQYVPDGGASGFDQNAPLAITPPPDPTPGEQFGTCGSGVYEAVEQYDNITDIGDLQALATALLARSGIVPITVQYETDFPGLRVGMKQNGNIPRHLLNNEDLFITELDGKSEGIDYGHESTWRWQVTATNLVDDTNWKKWFERLVRRTQTPAPIPIPTPITFVLASFTAGTRITNPVPVVQSGRVDEITIVAGTPPGGQDLVIDLKANGVSILGPGKLVLPAGHTGLVILTEFASAILYLLKNDIMTIDASYRSVGGTIVAADNVTVSIRQIV